MKQCRMDCIHAEACRRFADNNTYWNSGDCPIYKPTADVAPKENKRCLYGFSIRDIVKKCEDLAIELHYFKMRYDDAKREVARLQEDVERLQEINNRQVENIKLAKQEVAREIFEEIERICVGMQDYTDYAELKKKYLEGTTDEV